MWALISASLTLKMALWGYLITLLKLVWRKLGMVTMNNWKTNCVGLHRLWVEKWTVPYLSWVNIPLAPCRRRLRYWRSTWQEWWHLSDLRSHRGEHSNEGGFWTTGYYSRSVCACRSRFTKQAGGLWRVETEWVWQTLSALFTAGEQVCLYCSFWILFHLSSVLWFSIRGRPS